MTPTFYHLELTSRCNKSCHMCGRRKLESERPELCSWGDMPLEMVNSALAQIPKGAVVQLHNNGEPLLYPRLGDVVELANSYGLISSLNTNGILLWEKRRELAHLNTLVISIIENDPDELEQLDTLNRYVRWPGPKPRLVLRFLGDVHRALYNHIDALRVTRTLHSPDGSRDYKKPVVIPEIGICLELLTHLAIDRYGNVSLCVRFDPDGLLRIGNLEFDTLEDCINGKKRQYYIRRHIAGDRAACPGCDRCDFWGCPVG